jgi:hypothetical protein
VESWISRRPFLQLTIRQTRGLLSVAYRPAYLGADEAAQRSMQYRCEATTRVGGFLSGGAFGRTNRVNGWMESVKAHQFERLKLLVLHTRRIGSI